MNYFKDIRDTYADKQDSVWERTKTAAFVTVIYILIGLDRLMGRDGTLK